MSEPLSDARLAEIRDQIERAHTELGEVCSEGPSRRFRMHVPADPARDTDLIITAALKGAEEAQAEVDRLNRENKQLRLEAERDEQTTGRLIEERDSFHELLDRFAAAVAPFEVIGEHSSGNDPWINALDLVTPAAEVDRLNAELKIACPPGLYPEIQQVLDGALGTNDSDGAGAGVVADIALVAERMRTAEAEAERLKAQVELLGNHLQRDACTTIDALHRRTEAEIHYVATGVGTTTTVESGQVVINITTREGRVDIDLGTEFAEPLGLLLVDDPEFRDCPDEAVNP